MPVHEMPPEAEVWTEPHAGPRQDTGDDRFEFVERNTVSAANPPASLAVKLTKNDAPLKWVGVIVAEETGAVVSTLMSNAVDEVCVALTPSIATVATARTAYVPSASVPVVHDHAPVVAFAVQVEPRLVHEPEDGSVPAAAVDNCTVAPTDAVPVKVRLVVEVMLSVFDDPLSDAAARSGVDTFGSAYRTITIPEPPAPPEPEASIPLPALLQ